ncbi:MAG: hypothetical protein ABI972_03570 [Acidobacteriota bacterium]
MRPRTKIAPEPNPRLSEFQNFDRLVRAVLMKPKRKADKPPAQVQESRLPRP